MRLWILRPVENLSDGDDPWEPWYDKSFGFVVRAETEGAARLIATKHAGDEKNGVMNFAIDPWLDSDYSTCTKLEPSGEAGLIMRDFWAA